MPALGPNFQYGPRGIFSHIQTCHILILICSLAFGNEKIYHQQVTLCCPEAALSAHGPPILPTGLHSGSIGGPWANNAAIMQVYYPSGRGGMLQSIIHHPGKVNRDAAPSHPPLTVLSPPPADDLRVLPHVRLPVPGQAHGHDVLLEDHGPRQPHHRHVVPEVRRTVLGVHL